MKHLLTILLFMSPSLLMAQNVESSSETTETRTITESHTKVDDTYMDETKPDDIGLGILAGGPTTVTGKYWLNEIIAIDFGAAFSDDDYAILGTYLHHFEGTPI